MAWMAFLMTLFERFAGPECISPRTTEKVQIRGTRENVNSPLSATPAYTETLMKFFSDPIKSQNKPPASPFGSIG